MNKPVIISDETLVAPVITEASPARASAKPALAILTGLSFSHFLNDLLQSLLPSIYPILKTQYALDYAQIGLITFTFQCTASLLQPVVGFITDRRPRPFSLALGMCSTLVGLLLLGVATQYLAIICAAALVGLGSAVFHPDASRITRAASGGRFGFAQSFFQLGGYSGTAAGPLLAALIVVPFGQSSVAWFSVLAFLAIVILYRIGAWYAPRVAHSNARRADAHLTELPKRRVTIAILVLVALLASKALYMSSLTSYYTLYLIHKFGISAQASQIYLFIFLGGMAAGTFFGGPLGDRFGRKYVIWFSILGALPFTLALPHAGLAGSAVLTGVIGFIIASAMPSIIVFAQELLPHRVGLVSGLFFGWAFGIGGIGAAVLGEIADRYGIDFVYACCAYLPAIGLLAVFLPSLSSRSGKA